VANTSTDIIACLLSLLQPDDRLQNIGKVLADLIPIEVFNCVPPAINANASGQQWVLQDSDHLLGKRPGVVRKQNRLLITFLQAHGA
jgi:hypothetical protein